MSFGNLIVISVRVRFCSQRLCVSCGGFLNFRRLVRMATLSTCAAEALSDITEAHVLRVGTEMPVELSTA